MPYNFTVNATANATAWPGDLVRVYDYPANWTGHDNVTGFWRERTVVGMGAVSLAADVGDALATVEQFEAGARVVQSVQTAAYLPLLAFYLLSLVLSLFTQFFPDCSKSMEALKKKKMAELEASLREARERMEEVSAEFQEHVKAAEGQMEASLRGGEEDEGGGGGGRGKPAKKEVELVETAKGKAKKKDDEAEAGAAAEAVASMEATAKAGATVSMQDDPNAALKEARRISVAAEHGELAERARALTLAMNKEVGLDDLGYFESLPIDLIEARLHLNQLEESVLRDYAAEKVGGGGGGRGGGGNRRLSPQHWEGRGGVRGHRLSRHHYHYATTPPLPRSLPDSPSQAALLGTLSGILSGTLLGGGWSRPRGSPLFPPSCP